MKTEDDETTAKEAAPEADEQSVAADMQSSVAAIVAAIKATSLRPPPERVVVEETPTADSNLDVREFGPVPLVSAGPRHHWRHKNLCDNCGIQWTQEDHGRECSEEGDGERAKIQLAMCFHLAEEGVTGTDDYGEGDYGWSPAFQAVKELREEKERLEGGRDQMIESLGETIERLVEEKTQLQIEIVTLRKNPEGVQESSAPIHLRKGEGLLKTKEGNLKVVKIEDLEIWAKHHYLKWAMGQIEREAQGNSDGLQGTAKAAYMAVITLRTEYNQMCVSLDAERAANADKVQIIDRQCQERRAIKAAVEKGDMDELRAILNPPESDEPESVKETKMKTVVLDAGPDHLKIVEIENVTALRAERDRLKKSYAKARNGILRKTPCKCGYEISESLESKIHAPICPLGIALTEFPKSP